MKKNHTFLHHLSYHQFPTLLFLLCLFSDCCRVPNTLKVGYVHNHIANNWLTTSEWVTSQVVAVGVVCQMPENSRCSDPGSNHMVHFDSSRCSWLFLGIHFAWKKTCTGSFQYRYWCSGDKSWHLWFNMGTWAHVTMNISGNYIHGHSSSHQMLMCEDLARECCMQAY